MDNNGAASFHCAFGEMRRTEDAWNAYGGPEDVPEAVALETAMSAAYERAIDAPILCYKDVLAAVEFARDRPAMHSVPDVLARAAEFLATELGAP